MSIKKVLGASASPTATTTSSSSATTAQTQTHTTRALLRRHPSETDSMMPVMADGALPEAVRGDQQQRSSSYNTFDGADAAAPQNSELAASTSGCTPDIGVKTLTASDSDEEMEQYPGDDAHAPAHGQQDAGIHDGSACDGDGANKQPQPSQEHRSAFSTVVDAFKYAYSMCLLLLSVFLVMTAIFARQTTATSDGVHPAIAFFTFWFLIAWLGMMEGGQGCLVGLQPIDKTLYAESHPTTHRTAELAHKGANMDRFIIGRQFLVVLVVFVSNLMSSAIPEIDVLGINESVQAVFLSSGIALILTTVTLGQLTAQVNAANCMLDFVNTYFMTFTTYISLAIEASGLLHCVYLVQYCFSALSGGKSVSGGSSGPAQASILQRAFFWIRVIGSCGILGFAFAVTITAILGKQTTMWDGVPSFVSIILFFVLMCFAGLLDGMQIALFAVVNLPDAELKHHTIAHRNCQLTFGGNNLQAFLIGRQICVTICTFVIARIATLGGSGDNIFGVPDAVQSFFNTGLLGAIITTVVASLAWRVVASSFPIAFLSNPLINVTIRLCLLLEASGICSSAWLLARAHKRIAGYQIDETYIGSAEQRAAAQQCDDLILQEEGMAESKQ